MTRPCAFCGGLTGRLYSFDMDLPGVPLCSYLKPPVLVPAEAAMVQQAFERYATGTQSAQQIAAWFNAQGARPRSKRGTTNFTKATITDMLANRFYTGVVSYRGDTMPGAHPAIVDEVLFERVERARHARRVRIRGFLYRGILVAARRGRCSASARVYRFGNGPEVLDGAICGVAAMEGPGGCYDPAMKSAQSRRPNSARGIPATLRGVGDTGEGE